MTVHCNDLLWAPVDKAGDSLNLNMWTMQGFNKGAKIQPSIAMKMRAKQGLSTNDLILVYE